MVRDKKILKYSTKGNEELKKPVFGVSTLIQEKEEKTVEDLRGHEGS